MRAQPPRCPPTAPRTPDRGAPAAAGAAASGSEAVSAREDGQERAELDLGLVELRRRVGVADDAHARVEARLGAPQERAAQRDAELAVVVGVRPADRAGVPAAVEALERRDDRCGGG